MIGLLLKTGWQAFCKWYQQKSSERRQEKTLIKHGFDCSCPGCNKWMLTEKTIVEQSETEMHWHFLCECGHKSAWRLDGICPMLDPSYVEPVKHDLPDHY